MAIQLVGIATGSGTNGNLTISLTSLTGGIDTQPRQNDVIVVCTGFALNADGNPGVSTAGYTELADLWQTGIYDANLSADYLVCGASPPTSIVTLGSGNVNWGCAAVVAVFRGVDTTTPLDVTTTTATGTGSPDADPPSITPVTSGALVVAMGLASAAAGMTHTAPSGYTLAGTVAGGAGASGSCGASIAYKAWTSGAEDPGVFTGSSGGSNARWCAVTLALRPLPGGNIKAYTGAAFAVKPVKVWNGSAWVQKPLKRWNGSAWVVTNY